MQVKNIDKGNDDIAQGRPVNATSPIKPTKQTRPNRSTKSTRPTRLSLEFIGVDEVNEVDKVSEVEEVGVVNVVNKVNKGKEDTEESATTNRPSNRPPAIANATHLLSNNARSHQRMLVLIETYPYHGDTPRRYQIHRGGRRKYPARGE